MRSQIQWPAWRSGWPDFVWMIAAPKGRGLGVLSERAVKATSADMRWRSWSANDDGVAEDASAERGLLVRAKRLAGEEGTPILEISMESRNKAPINRQAKGLGFHRIQSDYEARWMERSQAAAGIG